VTSAHSDPDGDTNADLLKSPLALVANLTRCTRSTVSKTISQDCVNRQTESVGREVRHSADAHFAESKKNVKQPFSEFFSCSGKPLKFFSHACYLLHCASRRFEIAERYGMGLFTDDVGGADSYPGS
jgi:hypothetical protein